MAIQQGLAKSVFSPKPMRKVLSAFLQMRELRLKEGIGVAQGLPADKAANSVFEPDLCPDL